MGYCVYYCCCGCPLGSSSVPRHRPVIEVSKDVSNNCLWMSGFTDLLSCLYVVLEFSGIISGILA